MATRRKAMAGLLAGLALRPALGWAAAGPEPLPAPQGEVILSVSGDVAVTNAPGAALFDRAMLAALGSESFRTSTNWTEGVLEFRGVPLRTLLDRLGIRSGTLHLTALNDYTAEVPVADAVEGGPILATEMAGRPMSVRQKGPIWLIYPFDSNPAYQTEVIYSRSIWQLDRIVADQDG